MNREGEPTRPTAAWRLSALCSSLQCRGSEPRVSNDCLPTGRHRVEFGWPAELEAFRAIKVFIETAHWDTPNPTHGPTSRRSKPIPSATAMITLLMGRRSGHPARGRRAASGWRPAPVRMPSNTGESQSSSSRLIRPELPFVPSGSCRECAATKCAMKTCADRARQGEPGLVHRG